MRRDASSESEKHENIEMHSLSPSVLRRGGASGASESEERSHEVRLYDDEDEYEKGKDSYEDEIQNQTALDDELSGEQMDEATRMEEGLASYDETSESGNSKCFLCNAGLKCCQSTFGACWNATAVRCWAHSFGPIHDRFKQTRVYPYFKKYWMLVLSAVIVYMVIIICGMTLWTDLTWQGWVTLLDVGLVLILLVNDTYEPHFTMVLGVVIILITTVITPAQSLEGAASPSVASIGILFVVAKAIEQSGVMKYVLRYVLGKPRWYFTAMVRLLVPVSILSAFTNNTPIVAMMIPLVQSWCRLTSFKASKFLMPLSFATILGGTCTLIGTSTNLVVLALVQEEYPDVTVGFFEIGIIGFPVLVVGLIYIILFAKFLLPVRSVGAESFSKHPREYTAAVQVADKSPVCGKTIEEAGLRHLPNVYLMEIQRYDGNILAAPPPTTILNANDILYFVGVITHMTAVYEVDGLVPAGSDQVQKLTNIKHHILCEAVVGHHFPHLNMTVSQSKFRSVYNAAIISVHRAGERVNQRIGDITLRVGDTLLLETSQNFIDQYKDSSHFSLISRVEGMDSVIPKQNILNMLFVTFPTCIMIVSVVFDFTSLLAASSVVMCFYIIFKRVSVEQAMKSLHLDLLIIIAAGFALGTGLDVSGASEVVSASIFPLFESVGGDIGVLTGLYIVTAVLSMYITNAAAVTLMFPVASQFLKSSPTLGVKAIVFVLMMAASSSFATAVGYQTNLLVWGPGGYTNRDYCRFGLPLTFISLVITIPLTYMLYGGTS